MSGEQDAETVRRLAPADTWPDLRLTIRPLPWAWKLKPRFYADDNVPFGFCALSWLFLTVEWWAQAKPSQWFIERTQPDTPGGAS